VRNCYCKHAKLSSFGFRQILRLFALDLTASDAARLSGVSVRSINEIYLKLRERLARECERRRPFKGGEVEIDESYFGPVWIRPANGWVPPVLGSRTICRNADSENDADVDSSDSLRKLRPCHDQP